ncbi:hypothetical protein ACH5RR_040966 [Cinchona calisaya]|uniref:Gag protein n=1 Tax=Cinchona calisaya TaxID=153742 RepID=A0ABD2XVF3_9GENT
MPPRTRSGSRGRGRGSAQQDPQPGERLAGGDPLQEIPVVESASESVTRPAVHPRDEAGPSAPPPPTGPPVVDYGAIAAIVAQVIRQLGAERPPVAPPPPPPRTDIPSLFQTLKKAGLPTFDGAPDPLKAESWMGEIERDFELFQIPVESQTSLAIPFLVAEAAKWWQTVEATLPHRDSL